MTKQPGKTDMVMPSVNRNVAALLRNRRDHTWPNVADRGRIAVNAGAGGLTVHPRPDQRYMRPSDVHDLRQLMVSEFLNRAVHVEGFPEVT